MLNQFQNGGPCLQVIFSEIDTLKNIRVTIFGNKWLSSNVFVQKYNNLF